VLLTSADERLAGDGHKEKTLPTWFRYPAEEEASRDGKAVASLGGGRV
jgi:hypothetical protein